jgi:hypothetical protein
MNTKNYKTLLTKTVLFLAICCFSFSTFSQKYVNDMDYVIGDSKQAFITNAITTEAQADNLLLGFKNMGANGVRIPLFGRGVDGVDLNPNKPMFDYFYAKAVAEGYPIFANPAQGGGGKRVANNRLNGNGANEGEEVSVNGVQAATDELVNRVIEFSNEYPDCKWINPFNEDGRATSSTWSINQINEIYKRLYEHGLNGAELIGPCTWGLVAGIDMLEKTNIADYITVAASHNLGFNHNLWDDFIAEADKDNLPVWDSEVNHNDKFPDSNVQSGTRLERAIENKVDGLVLYNSWNTISLTDGSINASAESQKLLYIKDYTIPVYVNLALDGVATQSETATPQWILEASRAIDGNTAGSFAGGNGSISHTSGVNPWWQVDLLSDKDIGSIKIYNRTDSGSKENLSNFTVSVINANGIEVFSETFADYPDPSIIVQTRNTIGRIVKIQINATRALTLAEVQVFAPEVLSVDLYEDIKVVMSPNPFSDNLKITSPNADFNSFTIYNINGQKVLSNKVEANSSEININTSRFSKGIYFVKLNSDTFSKSYKIIKN